MTLIDVADGQARWHLPGRAGSVSETGHELVLLDTESDARVIDLATGTTLQTISVDQAEQAGLMGPWVAVTTPTEVRVHDRSTGEELFRRTLETGSTPEATNPPTLRLPFAAVVVGQRVIVAWTPDATSSEIELAIYSFAGQLEQTMSVDLPEPHLLGLQLHGGDGQFGNVQLITHGPIGGFVTSVDFATQEVVVHEGRRPVSTRNGLLVAHDEAGLHLTGPNGEITVHHADQLASTDPLIVHGVGGLLHLDRDMIDHRDAP